MTSKDPRDELYRQHAPAAIRRAERLLGSSADAYEVVHDVFIALFEQVDQYRGGSMSGYVYSAVTHACLNRIRNQRKRYRLALENHAAVRDSADPGTAAEWSLAARAVLEDLPLPLAQVAVYYYLDELTQREIAELLGCSHRHVGELLARLSRWAERQERRTWQR